MILSALTTLAALALGAVFARPKEQYSGPLPRKHADRMRHVTAGEAAFVAARDARDRELKDESVRNEKESAAAIAALKADAAQMWRDLHDTLVADFYCDALPLVHNFLGGSGDVGSSEPIRELMIAFRARCEEELGEPMLFDVLPWAFADAMGVRVLRPHQLSMGYVVEHNRAKEMLHSKFGFREALGVMVARLSADLMLRDPAMITDEERAVAHDAATDSELHRRIARHRDDSARREHERGQRDREKRRAALESVTERDGGVTTIRMHKLEDELRT